MINVLGFLLILVVCSLAATGNRLYRALSRRCQNRTQCLRKELFAADMQINGEFQRARRAMNDAANQSWRDLAG